jgi:site-specific recombinase XerD
MTMHDQVNATHAPLKRVVQLLLGHTKIESTVRYLGIEVDDALAIAEQVDV